MKDKEKDNKENRFSYGSDLGLEVVSKGDKIQKSEQNKLKGGVADNKTPFSIADKHGVEVHKILKELAMGVVVEKEHTEDLQEAYEIAMDHMTESPEYYTKLAEMESSFDEKQRER